MTIRAFLQHLRDEIPVIVEIWDNDLGDYTVLAHGYPRTLLRDVRLRRYDTLPYQISVVDRPDPDGYHGYLTTMQVEIEASI